MSAARSVPAASPTACSVQRDIANAVKNAREVTIALFPFSSPST